MPKGSKQSKPQSTERLALSSMKVASPAMGRILRYGGGGAAVESAGWIPGCVLCPVDAPQSSAHE